MRLVASAFLCLTCALPSCTSGNDGDVAPRAEGEGEGEGNASEGEGELDGGEDESDAGEGEGEGEAIVGIDNDGDGMADGAPQTAQPENVPAFSMPLTNEEHVCEGDEDLCEPVGDLQKPYFDVLATWSHVEGDELVVQVLFRGTSFLCWGQLALMFAPGAEPSAAVPACAGNESTCQRGTLYVSVYTWNEYDENGLTSRAFFPPVDTQFYYTELVASSTAGFLPGLVSFGREGRLLEVRLPLAVVSNDASAPAYQLWVNYGGDLIWGEDVFGLMSSAGGRIDDEEPATAFMETTVFDGSEYCHSEDPS